MLVAEEQGRQGAQRDALRLRHFAGDGGEVLAAQPLDLAGREGRIADDVGEQVERRPEIGAQGGERDIGPVERRARS